MKNNNSNDKFERELLDELRSDKEYSYAYASIYTILLDLVEGDGIEEVVKMLYNVAIDKGLKSQFNIGLDVAKKMFK